MYKKCNFPKMGTKRHQLGKKKEGSMTPEEHQKKRQETIKKHPLW